MKKTDVDAADAVKAEDSAIIENTQDEGSIHPDVSLEMENATLKQQMSDLQAQMATMMEQFSASLNAKNQEITETKVLAGVDVLDDDRNELVEIAYNTPKNGFVYKTLPKKQAIEALYEYFRYKKNQIVDHGEIYDSNLDDTVIVNEFTTYIKMRKRDLASRKYKTVLHQVPAYVAVDRLLQGNDVEIIAKGEYDRFMQEKMEDERKFNVNYFDKKRLRAMEAIAKIPTQ